MGKKTYMLIRVLDASRLVLGDKSGFGKSKEQYDQLEEELKKDWMTRHSVPVTDRKNKFLVGEHVLVKSVKLEGPRRAIILDINGMNTSSQERCYSVFLYDDGGFEDLGENSVAVLSAVRKQQLQPRSIIVRLTGTVPAKVVMDLAKKTLNKDDSSPMILTQDSSWSNRANRLVTEWLRHPDLKYLGIRNSKTNDDGSVFGDIYRRLHLKSAGADAPESNTHQTEPNKKPKEFLTDYIINDQLGLYNAGLAKSQLTVRVSQQRELACNGNKAIESLPKKEENSIAYTDKYDDKERDVLSETRLEFSNPSTVNIESEENENARPDKREILDLPPQTNLSIPACITQDSVSKNFIDTSMDRANSESINIPGRLLVRGKNIRPGYQRIEEYRLHKNIIKALEALQITELSEVQRIVGPNFIRSLDMIVIAADGGTQRGKNMRVLSYILPILRITYEKYENRKQVDENEPPETIIIVNSYNTGTNIESFINQLLNYSQDLPMRVKFISRDGEVAREQLRLKNYRGKMVPGGYNILIMTVSYFGSVLQTRDGTFLFQNLRFLIFEELDLYLRSHNEDILTFVDAARQNYNLSSQSLPFQVTMSGNKWSMEMESMYKDMIKDRPPMVTIAAPNQVLRYAKIEWKVFHVKQEDARMQNLFNLLKYTCVPAHDRIVIACSTPSVAELVYEALNLLDGVQLQIATSTMDDDSLKNSRRIWDRRNVNNIYIISDDMMYQAGVTNTTCLICYDSPEMKIQGGVRRSVAAERFSYLWSNIRHIHMEHAHMYNGVSATEPPYCPDLVAYFLMTGDEQNFYPLYKFASSLERVEFPPELKQLATRMEQLGLQEAPLCQGIKLFGFCNRSDPGTCSNRHQFSEKELSSTPSAPLTGELEVRIIKCENPSSYQAQLMRHYVFDNGRRICNRSYINESRQRKNELNKYYNARIKTDDMQVKNVKTFKEGTWCAVKVPDSEQDYFARAKIERILKTNGFNDPTTVRVYCVDYAIILNPPAEQLYELPQEYQQLPNLVVNLILCNLKPRQGEMEYRQSSENRAGKITNDQIYHAKIWLSVGNTVWVNPMVEYHLDKDTGKPFKGDSIRLLLINDKIVDFNEVHLKVLMESVNKFPGVYKGITSLAKSNADFADEIQMMKQEFHQLGDKIQWAFVGKSRRDKIDPAKIVTQFCYDPWMFFGVQDKFYEHLKNLEKRLNVTIEKYLNGAEDNKHIFSFKEVLNQNYYEVGMVVAAKERGDKTWMRGLIMDKFVGEGRNTNESLESSNRNNTFEVFFVDYGDLCSDMKVQELFPIPHQFVVQLPFQAIAFRLDHIRPVDQKEYWNEREKDAFFDIIVRDGLGIDIDVMAYDDGEDDSSNPIPCRYYNSVAFYKEKEIGCSLIERGIGELCPGKENLVPEMQQHLLDFYNASVKLALAESDDDDEEEMAVPLLDEEKFDYNFDVDDFNRFFGTDKNGSKPINGPRFLLTDLSRDGSRQLESAPVTATTSGSVEASTSSSAQVNNSTRLGFGPPANVLGPSDGFHHPKVIWRQTDESLILTVQLPDVNQYELKVLEDKYTIMFKTLDKSPTYGFTLKFYGRIEPTFSSHIMGQYSRFTFTKKMKGVSWRRPLYCGKEKYQWFQQDLNYLPKDEDDEEDITDDDPFENADGWKSMAAEARKSGTDNGVIQDCFDDGDSDDFSVSEDDDSDDDEDERCFRKVKRQQ